MRREAILRGTESYYDAQQSKAMTFVSNFSKAKERNEQLLLVGTISTIYHIACLQHTTYRTTACGDLSIMLYSLHVKCLELIVLFTEYRQVSRRSEEGNLQSRKPKIQHTQGQLKVKEAAVRIFQ